MSRAYFGIMRLTAITLSGFSFKRFHILERIYPNQDVNFLFFLSPGSHSYKSLGSISKYSYCLEANSSGCCIHGKLF